MNSTVSILKNFWRLFLCFVLNIHKYTVYDRDVWGYKPKILNGTNYDIYYIKEHKICDFCYKTKSKIVSFKTKTILFDNTMIINEYLKNK